MSEQVLLETVNDEQRALIEVVARPWHVNSLEDSRGWPTWDFVQRRYRINNPEYPSAGAVLESLPSIAVSGKTYGLVWIDRQGALRPADRIGLTIAGLYHLVAPDPVTPRPDLGNACLAVLRKVAELDGDAAADLDWTTVVSKKFDLRRDYFSDRAGAPVVIVGEILRHEFPPVAYPSTQHNYEISYGDGRFQRFIDVKSIEEYVARVADAVDAAEPAVVETTMDIGVAVDYLSMTLQLDRRWASTDPLMRLTQLEDAMIVARAPASRAEFNECVSSLANILGQFRTIAGSDEAYEQRGWGKEKRPLNDLEIWLDETISDPGCNSSVADLRRILQLRQEAQHRSSATAARAARARRQLGLTDPITDWAASWCQVTQKAANAVAHIARTVRRAD